MASCISKSSLGAPGQLDVDDVGHREHADGAQGDLKWPADGRALPYLFARHLPIHSQRTRRQHADVRVGVAARHQFFPQIVQETAQRIGNVNHQGEDIQTLLGRNLKQHPVRIKTHSLLHSNRFVVFVTQGGYRHRST